jgi:hypothetical protein
LALYRHFTSDIVVGIHLKLSFQARDFGYSHQYISIGFWNIFASTIISNGLPNIDNDLYGLPADAMIPAIKNI